MSAYPANEVVYRTDAFRDREVVRPRDKPPAVGLLSEPGGVGPIGIAYPVSWMAADEEAGRPAETLGRLVVGQVEVPGRFVLRRGEFRCVPGPA
jgi:hypothetical protein